MSDDDAMMALLARMGGEKSKKAIKDAGVGAGGKRKAGDAEEGDGRRRPVKKVPKGPGRDEWAAGAEELARMIPSVGAAGGGGGEGGGEDAWVVWNERVRVPSEVLDFSSAGASGSPPPPPRALMDINRRLLVRGLYKRLEKLCEGAGITVDNTWFERWLFNLREVAGAGGTAGGSAAADPLLPSGAGAGGDHGLGSDLKSAGCSKNGARKITREMGKAAANSAKKLAQLGHSLPASSRVRVSGVEVEGKRRGKDGGVVVPAKKLTVGKTSVEVNEPHFDKLRKLFSRASGGEGAGGGGGGQGNGAFLEAAFCVLLRYHTLHGGGVRGGGFQAALPGACFDVLLSRFGVRMECFASPLNCRYERFCSMFLDTDAPFGSVGDFFSFRPARGSFEANPPFVPELIARMEAHMSALLAAAEGRGAALQFVVVAWEETAGWQHLNKAAFNKHTLRLSAREHFFYEGLQHARPTRSRVSTCPTSVFFLQTSAAMSRWPASEEACRELLRAFAER